MEGLGKKFLALGAGYVLDFLRDEEKMESVWEYLEDRAEDTDTNWDDLGVSALRSAWPSVAEMAADYVESLID